MEGLIYGKNIPRFCFKVENCPSGEVSKLRKPGRKRSGYPTYDRRGLSSDARVIVALLKKQPQEKDELCKTAGVSTATFYRIRRILEDSGIIKEVEGRFALWTFREIEKSIEDALLRLIKKGYMFTIEDLCNEVGKPWQEIESLAYALFKKHNLIIKTINGKRFILSM